MDIYGHITVNRNNHNRKLAELIYKTILVILVKPKFA